MTDNEMLDIIRRLPGASAVDIFQDVVSRSRAGRWFGSDSFLAALFGGRSISDLYVTLLRLEKSRRVRSEWGKPGRTGHRPRHYWVIEP